MQPISPPEDSAFPFLDLRLFGSFTVTINGSPLPRLRTRKGGVILALLALKAGKPVEREWLAGTLWPDSEPSQALYNLRQSLTDLRRALGLASVLLHAPTSRTLLLGPEGVSCDALEFDRLVAQPDAASWEAALSLYGGPLLEGWYEDCLLGERQRREEAFRKALNGLVKQARATGNLAETIPLLRRLLLVEPERERTWQYLMEALAASGDYAGMTESYRRFRLYLHDTLNTSPAAETAALYQRLRQEARGVPVSEPIPFTTLPSPTVRGNLPQPSGMLIGRQTEVAEIVETMQSAWLVTLTGAGGIGKTRLALAVAAELAGEYPQGVWWIDLAVLAEGREVPQAVAFTLGLREHVGEPLLQTLLCFLQQRHLLLVLDNCEHIRDDCSTLCSLVLSRCAGVRFLTTSRQTLGVSGEMVWQVPSLPVPSLEKMPVGERERLEAVRDSAAAQLLVERAKAVQRSFGLTVKNAFPIAQICARLDGLPLALELAAARFNVLSVEQIAARLDQIFPLLTRGNTSAPTRQQTMRALVDWSYDLLSDPEKALLQRLSVFKGGWTLEAAEHLSEHSELETLDLLSNLIERSLVLMETTDEGVTRYRMLETIRQYAAEKLQLSANWDIIHRRHAHYFLLFSEAQLPWMNGPQETLSLDRLEREHDNLRAALRFQFQDTEEAESGLRFIVALGQFWVIRGYLLEGMEFVLQRLAHPGAQQPTELRASALATAGTLALALGNFGPGVELLEEGLTLCRGLSPSPAVLKTRASMLNTLGVLQGRLGNAAAESLLLEECLIRQQEIGNKAGIAVAYGSLGILARKREEYETARVLQAQGLVLAQEIGDTRVMAWALRNLGTIAFYQAHHSEACAYLERSLALNREIGNKAGISLALNELGCTAVERGEYELAQQYYEESLALDEARADRDAIALSLGNLGMVFTELGAFERGQALLQRSLMLGRELGAPRTIALTLNNLGDLARMRKDYPSALLHYEESLALFESVGISWGAAYVLNNLGRTLCATREWESAAKWLIQCLRLCEETGNTDCAEDGLESSARLMFLTGQPEKALRLYSTVDALRKTNDHPRSPREQEEMDSWVAQARAEFPLEIAGTLWEAGQHVTLDAAIAEIVNMSAFG